MAMSAAEFKQTVAAHVATFSASGVLLNDAEDQAMTTVCLLIPEPCVSILIGAGGGNVSETKNATGCDISFCKSDESIHALRKCFHKGTVTAVAKAVFVAASFIAESRSNTNGLSVVVKTEAAGAVIGKGGANLKSIREVTGCNTNFEKPEEITPAFAGRRLTFRHPEAGQALLMAQAVYMTLRFSGFASPTQNDCRKAMGMGMGMGAPDMGMGMMMGDFGGNYGYGAAPTSKPQRASPYGGRPEKMAMGAGVCAIHGKKRGAKNLQPHMANSRLMVCADNDPCKGVDPAIAAQICSTHGKKRGAQNLTQHPSAPGLSVCHEHDPCK
jgi:transcription antitermination factor NusA-like protein